MTAQSDVVYWNYCPQTPQQTPSHPPSPHPLKERIQLGPEAKNVAVSSR